MKSAALALFVLLVGSSSAFAGNCSDPPSLQTLAEIRRCMILQNQAELIAVERDALVDQIKKSPTHGQTPSPVPQAQVCLKGPLYAKEIPLPQHPKEIPIIVNVTEVPLK